jgi:hypothetical protein
MQKYAIQIFLFQPVMSWSDYSTVIIKEHASATIPEP